MLRKLPTGIQSFEQIRYGRYVYVDKVQQNLRKDYMQNQ